MLRTFDISNLDYLLCQKHLRSTTLGCEDIAGLQKIKVWPMGQKLNSFLKWEEGE